MRAGCLRRVAPSHACMCRGPCSLRCSAMALNLAHPAGDAGQLVGTQLQCLEGGELRHALWERLQHVVGQVELHQLLQLADVLGDGTERVDARVQHLKGPAQMSKCPRTESPPRQEILKIADMRKSKVAPMFQGKRFSLARA
eukprot:1036044-Pyramimonas_sp.AAC.1